MSWAAVIAAVLKIASFLIQFGREQKWFKAGEDAVVAAAALEVLRKTETGKKVLAWSEQLSDSDLDDWLRNLDEFLSSDRK